LSLVNNVSTTYKLYTWEVKMINRQLACWPTLLTFTRRSEKTTAYLTTMLPSSPGAHSDMSLRITRTAIRHDYSIINIRFDAIRGYLKCVRKLASRQLCL